jgi:hypothetical protein
VENIQEIIEGFHTGGSMVTRDGGYHKENGLAAMLASELD